MSIQDELNQIKNAVYGKDVRDAIHDSIKKTYDDASASGNANMEVEMARGTEPTLNDRLGKMDDKDAEVTAQLAQNTEKIDSNHNEVTAQLAQKANQEDVDNLDIRMNDVIQSADLDPNKDQEIVDARHGEPTLGNKIGKLSSHLEIAESILGIYPDLLERGSISDGGTLNPQENRVRFAYPISNPFTLQVNTGYVIRFIVRYDKTTNEFESYTIANYSSFTSTGEYNVRLVFAKNNLEDKIYPTDNIVKVVSNTIDTLNSNINELSSILEQSESEIIANNLVTNGDFELDSNEDGLADDWATGSTYHLEASEKVIGINSQAIVLTENDSFIRRTDTIPSTGHKYYLSCYIKAKEEGSFIRLGYRNDANIVSVGGLNEYVAVDKHNDWKRYSFIWDDDSESWFNVGVASYGTTSEEFYIDGFMLVDLSDTFGVGNEPTKEQFETMLEQFPNGWFDGRKNVFSVQNMLSTQLQSSPVYCELTDLPIASERMTAIVDDPQGGLIWSDRYCWRWVRDNTLAISASGYKTVKVSDGSTIAGNKTDDIEDAHSVTKVLSALVVANYVTDYSETITLTSEDVTSDYEGFVQPGDTVTLETLLNSSLIQSDNNAAEALARPVGYIINPNAESDSEARTVFFNEMKEVLNQLGMTNSTSISMARSGLRSTPSDLCKLYRHIQQNVPVITDIWGKLSYEVVVAGTNPRSWSISSTTSADNRLIIPEFIGGKTGSSGTHGAYGFVWRSTVDNELYLSVLMNFLLEGNARFKNSRQIIDEAYSLTKR